jgi:cytochrome b561
MVTEPISISATSPVVSPTVAIAVLLLVYVTAPLLALVATTVNAASVRLFVVGGLINASVGVPFETVSVLLVTGVGALYCADSAWDAVNVAVPAATKVIMPLLGLIVATPAALLEYVIAPLLSLVGTVSMLNGTAPNVFDSATENDDRDVVPNATVSVLLVTGVGASYCADSAWDAVNVAVPAATKVIIPLLGLIVATPVALLEYVIAPLLSLVGTVSMLNGTAPNVFDPATENDVRDVVANATASVLLFLTEDAYWGVESCVAIKNTVPPPTRFIKFPEASMVATAGLLVLYVIAPLLLMLVGAVIMLNDASPNVLLEATRNEDPEKSEAPRATASVLLVTGVGALYCADSAWDAVNVTVPEATRVIMPLLGSIVATSVALLEYVIAPLLSVLGAVMLNGASSNVFDPATENNVRDVVPNATVSVLLVTGVGALYCADSAWAAVNVAVPAATKVIMPLLGLIVATPVALLEYVIAPLLSLVGTVSMLNGTAPNVFDPATENDVRDVVPRETVSVLLVFIALKYCSAWACVALKLTSPAPTKVIKFPDASMVATAVLLLLYVIAPMLSLVGRVIIANDASPNVFVSATVNVEDEKVEISNMTSKNTIPLEYIPSPPYNL